jgi:hypothetical protein
MFPLTENEYDFIYAVISDGDKVPQEARDAAFELLLERELLLTCEFSMSGIATGVMRNDDK